MKMYLSLLLAAVLLPYSATQAQSSQGLAFALTSSDSLNVFGPDGSTVATLTSGTVGKPISVPPYSFLASFGRDANSSLMLIIAPQTEKPSSLRFTTAGRVVEMDSKAFVTITYSANGTSATIDPGYIGEVKVDGTVITTAQKTLVQSQPMSSTVRTTSTRTTIVDNSVPPAPSTYNNPSLPTSAPSSMLPTGYWIEPVTPPGGKAPECASTEMKLVEVRGDVTVAPKGSSAFKKAEEGQTISAGDAVRTGDGANVAVFMGGVNSVRLDQSTEAVVHQTVANNQRDSTVDLKKGTVFARVGRRTGETQDFKIKTSLGVAAAKGTQLAVKFGNGRMVVFTTDGKVSVFDADGKPVATATVVSGTGKIILTGLPPLSPGEEEQAINDILMATDSINAKLNVILAKDTSTWTPEEIAFVALIPKIGFVRLEEPIGDLPTNPFGPFLDSNEVTRDLQLQLGPGDIPAGAGTTGGLNPPATTPI